MITLSIGGAQRVMRSPDEIDEFWINQQINGRRRDGQTVCLTIRVQETPLDLFLATAACAARGNGGGRPPRPEEERVFALWRDRELDRPDFAGGQDRVPASAVPDDPLGAPDIRNWNDRFRRRVSFSGG